MTPEETAATAQLQKAQQVRPVRTAVIGLGRAGWSIHVVGLKNRPEYQIVAAVDPEEERRKEAEQVLPGCRTYPTFEAFLKDPNAAELVIVATHSNTHGPFSIEALKAGFHVLVEKPMALNLREADRMIAAAKKAKRLLSVHQNLRAASDLHNLRQIIRSGILGRVFMIKRTGSNFSRRNDWQTLRKFGGGMLNNTCIHHIDQLLFLLDSPVVSVWGDLQRCVAAGDAEDHVKVLIRGKNGRVIDLEVTSACAVNQPPWIVMGTCGTLTRDGKDFVIKHLDPLKLKKLKVDARTAVPGRLYGVQGGDELEWQEKRVPANLPELSVDFYGTLHDSIRKGKKLFITAESVRERIQVLELARKGTKFPPTAG